MPSNLEYPGIYVEEFSSGVRTIQGVSTSSTAFIGTSVAGVLNQPVQVRSFAEFESTFGKLSPRKELGYAVKQFFLNGGAEAWVIRIRHVAGNANWLAAMKSLDSVVLFNLLVLPGITKPAIVTAAVKYCEGRRVFLILDSPVAQTPEQMRQLVESGALLQSANAAIYYPWIKIADPLNGNLPRLSPPGGTIAGLYSRMDSARGVWKAPAGTDATLAGVQELEKTVTDADNEALNSVGVNCLRSFPAQGAVAWGARTLAGAAALASEWKYIPVRRLALFLEESIYQGTKWAAFEPNAEPLWARLRSSTEIFLQNLFRQGAFQGQTPKDAYFVKCDAQTTTQNDINQGVMNIVIGFAPVKPAEFVLITLQQTAGRSSNASKEMMNQPDLQEIVACVRKKISGCRVLFTGPDEDTKRIAAGNLARQLDLDLFRVDLAAVVNKYIGETEKNLRRLFAAAQKSGAILFFDEGDALFGKRAEVKDSHDRYAKIEGDYLLQLIEEHDGPVIIAIKQKESLDAAFLRRLRFIIRFPPQKQPPVSRSKKNRKKD